MHKKRIVNCLTCKVRLHTTDWEISKKANLLPICDNCALGDDVKLDPDTVMRIALKKFTNLYSCMNCNKFYEVQKVQIIKNKKGTTLLRCPQCSNNKYIILFDLADA
jgi:DNA-directed RNA polymerase subunit RPC12/RpoP